MAVSEKIKTINNINETKQSKSKYNLDRQTTKILALPSINVDKYNFLTGEDIMPEKNFLEKVTIIKRFE